MKIDLISTLKDSLLEKFFPEGWNLKKLDSCIAEPSKITEKQSWWDKGFNPIPCANLEEFGMKMGHEIAMKICEAREKGKKLILILPVGPMGMYKWVVYFLKEWNVDCKHVYGFNMDE